MSDIKRFTDLSKLRLTSKPVKTKKVLLEVPVHKPSKEVWFRVHTSPDYTGNFHFIELNDSRDRDYFFVMPDVAERLNGIEPTLVAKTVFTCINRSGDVWLWLAAIPDDDNPNTWHATALECAKLAQDKWTRMVSNQAISSYEASVSELDIEPEWPGRTFDELLEVAFKGRIIDSMDHAVIRRLQGLA